MVIIGKVAEAASFGAGVRAGGRSIGLVPTMGALHDGHLSLVQRCLRENDVTVCSVFVNPIQFESADDLAAYPVTPELDMGKLRTAPVDMVFAPTAAEMYPGPVQAVFDLGGLDRPMEGQHRPGHFHGVAVVVEKLLRIIGPQRAYFGEKDFQQLQVVRRLVTVLQLPVDIVAMPTVREADGLAMSSRNGRLSQAGRRRAQLIPHVLFEARRRAGSTDVAGLIRWVENEFASAEGTRLQYFEIVDADTLRPVGSWDETTKPVACLAAEVEGVRLIDNIRF